MVISFIIKNLMASFCAKSIPPYSLPAKPSARKGRHSIVLPKFGAVEKIEKIEKIHFRNGFNNLTHSWLLGAREALGCSAPETNAARRTGPQNERIGIGRHPHRTGFRN
jgi:hypothetical protein